MNKSSNNSISKLIHSSNTPSPTRLQNKSPIPKSTRKSFKHSTTPIKSIKSIKSLNSPIKKFPHDKTYSPLKTLKNSENSNIGGACFSSPQQLRKSSYKTNSSKTYDRFIPNRNAMDMVSAQFSLKETNFTPKNLDDEALAYQEEIAKACGLALDKRILAFNADPPVSRKCDLRSSWNKPLKAPNSRTAKRKILVAPEKVLDAPGMIDDYYLNLLHWSCRNMLAVGLEKTVYLWDASSGVAEEFLTTSENDSVASIQWTLDGSYLAVGLNSGDTQIWDVESGSKIRSMKGHAARVGVLSWDKHIVSSGCRDGSIWHHDVRVAKHKTAELLGHSAEVCGLEWRPDGAQLASGGNDNLVNIWDVRNSQPKATKNHLAAVKAIAWCPWQLNLLATGGGTTDKNIHFWNTSTCGKVATIATESQVTSLQWSREYKEIVSTHGFPNNQVSIWSYPSLNKVADLEGHDSRILHSSLSPDGQTLATAASDESLKLWKTFESKPKNKVKSDLDDLSRATAMLSLR